MGDSILGGGLVKQEQAKSRGKSGLEELLAQESG